MRGYWLQELDRTIEKIRKEFYKRFETWGIDTDFSEGDPDSFVVRFIVPKAEWMLMDSSGEHWIWERK